MAEPASATAVPSQQISQSPDAAQAPPPDSSSTENVTPSPGRIIDFPEPPAYFIESLRDAERLLAYAAQVGIEVDDETRDSILEARAAVTAGWSKETASNLLAALSKLSAQLNPVSAESLRSYDTGPLMRKYWKWAICLAAIIIPFSIASFITSALSTTIRNDVTNANELAVKLSSQFGTTTTVPAVAAPPGAGKTAAAASLPAGMSLSDALTELQDFASGTRAIYTRSRQLNRFIFRRVWDPIAPQLEKDGKWNLESYRNNFELPPNLDQQPLGQVVTQRVEMYQNVRYFAQEVVDDVSIFYGAITTCILPVLYALLGTCAYLLRSFQTEMHSRTFVPSHSHSSRFLIAAIVGGVVGLFNNFTTSQGASIPPLAIAFVVGYSVDVFFYFLEAIITAFTKKSGIGKAA